jgi:nitric oxide reductase activation protein
MSSLSVILLLLLITASTLWVLTHLELHKYVEVSKSLTELTDLLQDQRQRDEEDRQKYWAEYKEAREQEYADLKLKYSGLSQRYTNLCRKFLRQRSGAAAVAWLDQCDQLTQKLSEGLVGLRQQLKHDYDSNTAALTEDAYVADPEYSAVGKLPETAE